MRIVTLTLNPCIDESTRVERVEPDTKLRCDPPRREPGGGGLNVARAIARLGGDAEAWYVAGGPTGDILETILEADGVRYRRVHVEGWTRQNLMVTDRSTGKQYRFIQPGPELADDEWRGVLDDFAGLDPPPEYLVASGSLPPGAPEDFYARLGRVLPPETRYVLDTSGEALHQAVAEGADAGLFLLKPNVLELSRIVDRDLQDDPEAQEGAARELIEHECCRAVVISKGGQGALLVTAGEARSFRAPRVEVDSKVGAGDSMVAGMVVALARGDDLEEAVRFGVAAGAAAVTTPGSELCPREVTERLLPEVS